MLAAWEKLVSLVEFEPNTGCWLWPYSLGGGYPDFRLNKERWRGHRLSYLVSRGKIPTGMRVCHKCDVPRRVNPDHLFVGTAKDNTLDMVAKGRGGRPPHIFGARHHKAKLSEKDVTEIRVKYKEPGVTAALLATQYPASASAIAAAATGATWKHLPMPETGG